MKLFYAMGGGMGHLYRTKVFIQQAGFDNYKVVTVNPLVRKLFDDDVIILLDAVHYSSSWIDFINKTLPQLPVEELYVDTFPWGLVHELPARLFTSIPVYYIARRLRWDAYCNSAPPDSLRFEKTYIIEPLEGEHGSFVKQCSKEVTTLELIYPEARPDAVAPSIEQHAKPLWLIVHASNREELKVLYDYAMEAARLSSIVPSFLLISDQTLTGLEDRCIDYAPAVDFFPLADRIFCAAGYNTVQHALLYWHKVSFWPFPRKYDDQAWRLSYWQNKLTSHFQSK